MREGGDKTANRNCDIGHPSIPADLQSIFCDAQNLPHREKPSTHIAKCSGNNDSSSIRVANDLLRRRSIAEAVTVS